MSVRSAIFLAAAACAALMLWIGAASSDRSTAYPFKGRQADYYSLLVEGMIQGHFYLPVKADPRLSSPDPAVRNQAAYLLDAALFHGRYYLYYGVVPAVVLLLPYRLITGQDLALNTATACFCLMGFLASIGWLRRWWRDYGPARGGAGLAALLTLVLAVAPATLFLVRRASFYELPIAAGYFFLVAFFWALYEALHQRHAVSMLAAASLSAGLAVGCHPDHLALLLPLAAVAGWPGHHRCAATRRWVAAVLPALLIGIGLAYYNTARFHNPFEFGFRFGINSFFDWKRDLFDLRAIPWNLKSYLLTPPSFAPYFPFIFPGNVSLVPAFYYGHEDIHGLLPITLLAGWILAGAGLAWRRHSPPKPLRQFCTALAALFVIELVFVCLLVVRANRYTVDFQTQLALLLAIAAGWAWTRLPGKGLPVLWRAGVVALSLAATAFLVCASIEQFGMFQAVRPGTFAALSRHLDLPYAWFEPFVGSPPGPLTLTVRLAPQKTGVIEPLVSTGTPGRCDTVYLVQHPKGLASVIVDHYGYRQTRMDLFPVDPSREHTVEISLGSFYPPLGDPYYAANRIPPDLAAILKDTAYVVFDGKPIVNDLMTFYEAPPWTLELGANSHTLSEFKSRFSGTIVKVDREPLAPLLTALWRPIKRGLLTATVAFPDPPSLAGQPLLLAGKRGDGILVYAAPVGGDTYRLGTDERGYGATLGQPLPITPGPHRLDLVVGPLAAKYPWPAEAVSGKNLSALTPYVFVWLDGRFWGRVPVARHLDQFGAITLASNPGEFSSAAEQFEGQFSLEKLSANEEQKLLDRAVAQVVPPGDSLQTGLLAAAVKFPEPQSPIGQPLLLAGKHGDGILLYAAPSGGNTYRLAADDWGHATTFGETLSIARGLHQLRFVVGPLTAKYPWPAEEVRGQDLPGLSPYVYVWLDGRFWGRISVARHLEQFDSISLGANLAGFSTATAQFEGQFSLETLSPKEQQDLLESAAAAR